LDLVRVPDPVPVTAEELAVALAPERDLVTAQAIRYASDCPRWSSARLDYFRIPPRKPTG
jgi:hypothetical protein